MFASLNFNHDPKHQLRYLNGEKRASNQVIKAVVNRLLRAKQPIRILEIAAGASFGSVNYHGHIDYGIPDLARSLTRNKQVQIIATDIQPETITSIKEGRLQLHALVSNVYQNNANPPFEVKAEVSPHISSLFENIKSDGTLYLEQEQSEIVYNYMFRDRKSLRSVISPQYPIILMPPVFKSYEQEKFGLDIRGGISCDQIVDGGNFDLVFARHLNPSFYFNDPKALLENPQALLDILKLNLKPDGIVIAEIDHSARAKPPKIYIEKKS